MQNVLEQTFVLVQCNSVFVPLCHPIHGKVFSIQMLSQIVPRVCTLVLFIIIVIVVYLRNWRVIKTTTTWVLSGLTPIHSRGSSWEQEIYRGSPSDCLSPVCIMATIPVYIDIVYVQLYIYIYIYTLFFMSFAVLCAKFLRH